MAIGHRVLMLQILFSQNRHQFFNCSQPNKATGTCRHPLSHLLYTLHLSYTYTHYYMSDGTSQARDLLVVARERGRELKRFIPTLSAGSEFLVRQ
jgi:hypothetical protein